MFNTFHGLTRAAGSLPVRSTLPAEGLTRAAGSLPVRSTLPSRRPYPSRRLLTRAKHLQQLLKPPPPCPEPFQAALAEFGQRPLSLLVGFLLRGARLRKKLVSIADDLLFQGLRHVGFAVIIRQRQRKSLCHHLLSRNASSRMPLAHASKSSEPRFSRRTLNLKP